MFRTAKQHGGKPQNGILWMHLSGFIEYVNITNQLIHLVQKSAYYAAGQQSKNRAAVLFFLITQLNWDE